MFIPNINLFEISLIFAILETKWENCLVIRWHNNIELTFHRFLGKYLWIGHHIFLKLYFLLTDTMAISLVTPFGMMNERMQQLNRLYCTYPLRCHHLYIRIIHAFQLYRWHLRGPKVSKSIFFFILKIILWKLPVNTISNFPGRVITKSLALYWSPCAWRPIIIGFVHPGTNRGIFLHIIGSRNTVPPRILRIVPFGLNHIFFNLNSRKI